MSRSGAARTPAFGGLCVIVDDDPRWPRDPVEQARAACAGGAALVQLRSKHAGDVETLAWARAIRELTRAHEVGFFVNDRFDLALLAEAEGVHLGQQDLAPADLPEWARRQLRVGRSTHDDDELARAVREPVDYVAFGPIFGTTSKRVAHEVRGLTALEATVRTAAPRPVIAIGGIDAKRASDVGRTGAAGIAVIGAVAGTDDPVDATRRLVDSFGDGATR